MLLDEKQLEDLKQEQAEHEAELAPVRERLLEARAELAEASEGIRTRRDMEPRRAALPFLCRRNELELEYDRVKAQLDRVAVKIDLGSNPHLFPLRPDEPEHYMLVWETTLHEQVWVRRDAPIDDLPPTVRESFRNRLLDEEQKREAAEGRPTYQATNYWAGEEEDDEDED